MDATDRIVEEFNRLIALPRDGIAQQPIGKRIVYYVVAARCEIDINGFSSVYEQHLTPPELAFLVDGLSRIGEAELANEFRRGFDFLDRDGYYEHMNWSNVSHSVKAEIESIGHRIGDRLWELDAKLAAFLDDTSGRGTLNDRPTP